MYTVSSNYHERVADGVSPQDFFLFDAEAPFNTLSSLDGDFITGSPSIQRSVCESTDFTLGETPSASLSVSISNPYGDAIQFWSKRGSSALSKNVWARAGIGVMLSSTSPASVTTKADITITFSGGTTKRIYVDSQGRLYVGTSYVSGFANAVSIHAVYASSTSCTVYIGLATNIVYAMTVTSSTTGVPVRTDVTLQFSAPMLRKLCQMRGCAVYDSNGFPKLRTVYDTENVSHSETWEYCPVGQYLMKYPKYNLHSAVIDIIDAMDAIALLDT